MDAEDLAIAAMLKRQRDWRNYAISNIDAIPASSPSSSSRHYHQQQQPISPNYVCHRCGSSSHRIQKCPTNGDRTYDLMPFKKKLHSTAGIPRTFLTMKIEDTDLLLCEPRTHEFKKLTFTTAANAHPPHLNCSLCKKIFRNAVKMPCCSTSFCYSCLCPANDDILDELISCPLCKRVSSNKQLLLNTVLQEQANMYLS